MNQAGKLERIWIKLGRKGPMDNRERAVFVAAEGLVDNIHQGSKGGKRQVTLLDAGRWEEATSILAGPVDPIARRANLLLSGVDLFESEGRVLRVGACRVLIRGETKPCGRMDEAVPGLREALVDKWGGGAYGEVLDSGDVCVGDAVLWEPSGS